MSALGDVIVDALQEFLRAILMPIRGVIQDNASALLRTVVGTPHPDTVFTRPTNGAWPAIYDYYWDILIPLALSLWVLSIGLVIFLESTSHLFSSYHRSKLKRRAVTGLFGILAWWWVAALSLQLIDGLAGFLVPDLSSVSFFETLSFGAMGVLGLAISLLADITIFLLIALIYFMRHVVLYLFVLLMPLLIVFWIPGVGPFTLSSRFMKRLAGFYVPFLFMTVPVALLFRLGELLGASADLSMGGIGTWLTALVIPFVAVVSPFILFWQAGALFFMADRVSNHASATRARQRTNTAQNVTQATAQGGRNMLRGARGEPAIRSDGQAVLGSGDSRAHAAGSRLNATGSRLRTAVRRDGDRGGNGGQSRHSTDRTADDDRRGFGNLSDRKRESSTSSGQTDSDETDDTDDEPPRYIH